MANNTSSPEEEQAKIDAALDAALDEFSDDDDDDEDQEEKAPPPAAAAPLLNATKSETSSSAAPTTPKKKAVPLGPPRPPPASDEKLFADMMQGMLQGGAGNGEEDEDDRMMGQLMQQLMMGEQARGGEVMGGTASTSSSQEEEEEEENGSSPSTTRAGEPETAPEVQDAIRNLVQDMARQASLDEQEQQPQQQQQAAGGGGNADPNGLGGPEMDELQHLLDNLLGGIGEEGAIPEGGENADAVIDGMMEQLLSKDLMYEPIQQVAERFPQWLQEQQHTLSPDDYAQRHAQCQCFVDIVKVYENDPENTAKLVDMMQQLQEYGPPPKEIVQQIAPGLEDLDGMAGPGGEECRVM